VECICGALVTDERRTCPLCGRMIHPEAPVEVVGRSIRAQPNVYVTRRTVSKTKRMQTLRMFSTDQLTRPQEIEDRPTAPPNRRLPKWQGKELTEAFVELRGTAKRVVDPQGTPRWDFQSYHFALIGMARSGQPVQITLSKSFTLANPDATSPEALAWLDDLENQAMRLGFDRRPALVGTPWYALKFRPKVGW
jgi:hypothetical protein